MTASIGVRHTLGSRREHIRADVCVIGAGIAGLMAATRIAAAIRRPIIVIESGPDLPDPRMADLNVVDNPNGNYRGNKRDRGLGGTSSQWAGKLLPLSPHDMAARPHVGLDAWPIDDAALARYIPEIEAIVGAAPGAYDGGDTVTLDSHGHLPPTPGEMIWRWPKHPRRGRYRIDAALQDELARLDTLSIWVDATVTRLTMVQDRLATVTATNHRGGELVVEADHFVIAAGTLETTRLLLVADAQNRGCISRTTDVLGRFFNDHFGVEVATIVPRRAAAANHTLADRVITGTKRHLHGELTITAQRKHAAASAYFDIDPHFSDTSAIIAARAAFDSLRRHRPGQTAGHLAHVLVGLPSLGRATFWKMAHGQQYWPTGTDVRLKIWIEQLPRYDNRLMLGERLDSLGQPLLRTNLALTDDDERTARTMTGVLRQFWERDMTALADLQWLIPNPECLIEATVDHAHPAGSTRMGHHAAHAVVDPSLRLYAIANTYIASASVFPSSGSANPTLTIMQLAMMVADHVIRDHRGLSENG
ncbi:GMC oxidoreductase [Sphingomonas aquatilis]